MCINISSLKLSNWFARQAISILSLLVLVLFLSAPANAQSVRQVPASRGEIVLSFSDVVKKVSPAVVSISAVTERVSSARTSRLRDPFWQNFERLFGGIERLRRRSSTSLGSGVVVSESGLVITNAHVVKNAKKIKVSFTDGQEFDAKIVVFDEKLDMAAIRIDNINNEKFKSLKVSYDATSVEVGDLVLAIGNPYGVGQSVTSGIVSAVARRRRDNNGTMLFIQTDAAINPGNSGGALVNSNGELLGINTSIVSPSGASAGIGFATPTPVVALLMDAVRRGDSSVIRPWSGIESQIITDEIKKVMKLDSVNGALITTLHPLSPLRRAGIKQGDFIVSLDDETVDSPETFEFLFSTGRLNTLARISYLRSGKKKTVSVYLLPAPSSSNKPFAIKSKGILEGITVADMSPALGQKLGLSTTEIINGKGVVIVSGRRSSNFSRFAFKKGDIIISVNNVATPNSNALSKYIEDNKINSIRLKRDGRVLQISIN